MFHGVIHVSGRKKGSKAGGTAHPSEGLAEPHSRHARAGTAAFSSNQKPGGGGYYMMSRAAEKNLRAMQRDNPAAALVFSVIRENMQIGTNAVTISQVTLCKILNRSRATISRGVKYLADHQFVQTIKTGNVSTYVVNEQIAFAGTAGQRKAVFSATVVAHECEQEEGWDQVKKLKAVPVIYGDERPILGADDLPPPDQTDLDFN